MPAPSSWRVRSPAMGSTLMTSAPMRAHDHVGEFNGAQAGQQLGWGGGRLVVHVFFGGGKCGIQAVATGLAAVAGSAV